jgi:hypothetical protein
MRVELCVLPATPYTALRKCRGPRRGSAPTPRVQPARVHSKHRGVFYRPRVRELTDTCVRASAAQYDQAARQLRGRHAHSGGKWRLNFPTEDEERTYATWHGLSQLHCRPQPTAWGSSASGSAAVGGSSLLDVHQLVAVCSTLARESPMTKRVKYVDTRPEILHEDPQLRNAIRDSHTLGASHGTSSMEHSTEQSQPQSAELKQLQAAAIAGKGGVTNHIVALMKAGGPAAVAAAVAAAAAAGVAPGRHEPAHGHEPFRGQLPPLQQQQQQQQQQRQTISTVCPPLTQQQDAAAAAEAVTPDGPAPAAAAAAAGLEAAPNSTGSL